MSILSTGLALAVLGGRTVEAVIIGVILAPTLAFLAVWLYSLGGHPEA